MPGILMCKLTYQLLTSSEEIYNFFSMVVVMVANIRRQNDLIM